MSQLHKGATESCHDQGKKPKVSWDGETAQALNAIWIERDSHCWWLQRQCIRDSPDPWVSRPPQPAPQSSLNTYTYPSCSTLFLSEARFAGAREWKSTHLKRSEPAQNQPQGFSLSALGPDTALHRALSRAEGKPCFTPDPALPSSTSPPPAHPEERHGFWSSHPVLPSKPIR